MEGDKDIRNQSTTNRQISQVQTDQYDLGCVLSEGVYETGN